MATSQKEILAKLVADVEQLKLDVASLKEKPVEVPKVEVKAEPVEVYPVPQEYKDIVELTFNKEFGVRIEPLKDTPAFVFSIIVPLKYSKVTAGEDLRPKVLTYSDGVVGVRAWVDKVWNNLDSDTQSRIVTDRPFVEAKI